MTSKPAGADPFDHKTMPQLNVQAPHQDNYSDCGVFLLRYIEQFFGVNMKVRLLSLCVLDPQKER
eukprot:m.93612 g.93612  ORF g.93612 m.93612 type:complete len:65 (-) comp13816_c8_seq1:441-635(-)